MREDSIPEGSGGPVGLRGEDPGHSKKIWLQDLRVGSPGKEWLQVAMGKEGCIRSAGSLLSCLYRRWLSGTSVEMRASSGHDSHWLKWSEVTSPWSSAISYRLDMPFQHGIPRMQLTLYGYLLQPPALPTLRGPLHGWLLLSPRQALCPLSPPPLGYGF